MDRRNLLLAEAVAAGLISSTAAFAKSRGPAVGPSWSNFQEECWKSDKAAIKAAIETSGGIFLISHDIHDVFDLADRVMVMKKGQVVGSAAVADVTEDEVLGMIILGECPPGARRGPGAMRA